ncbi:MAG: Maf family protein [bacterium]
MKIILASRSPRRKLLMKKAGIPFRAVTSPVSEKTGLKKPSAIVKNLALKKAGYAARLHPGAPVLGADTIVVCKGKIIGKPSNRAHAMSLLRLQNGSWQAVYTGVAVVWNKKGKIFSGYRVSRCKARKFSIAGLERLAGKHMDKAGAYAVQDGADPFIEKIRGSYDNVVGFPLDLVRELLVKAGCRIKNA